MNSWIHVDFVVNPYSNKPFRNFRGGMGGENIGIRS